MLWEGWGVGSWLLGQSRGGGVSWGLGDFFLTKQLSLINDCGVNRDDDGIMFLSQLDDDANSYVLGLLDR